MCVCVCVCVCDCFTSWMFEVIHRLSKCIAFLGPRTYTMKSAWREYEKPRECVPWTENIPCL